MTRERQATSWLSSMTCSAPIASHMRRMPCCQRVTSNCVTSTASTVSQAIAFPPLNKMNRRGSYQKEIMQNFGHAMTHTLHRNVYHPFLWHKAEALSRTLTAKVPKKRRAATGGVHPGMRYFRRVHVSRRSRQAKTEGRRVFETAGVVHLRRGSQQLANADMDRESRFWTDSAPTPICFPER
jgi:hypothetical protein